MSTKANVTTRPLLQHPLHRILALLLVDMLLSSTASFDLLHLASYILTLSPGLSSFSRLAPVAVVCLFLSFLCYKILSAFWKLGF